MIRRELIGAGVWAILLMGGCAGGAASQRAALERLDRAKTAEEETAICWEIQSGPGYSVTSYDATGKQLPMGEPHFMEKVDSVFIELDSGASLRHKLISRACLRGLFHDE